MARVPRMQHPALPQLAALAGILPADAPNPIRFERLREGIIAAYSPAQVARADAWQILVDAFGPLRDVTPAVAL